MWCVLQTPAEEFWDSMRSRYEDGQGLGQALIPISNKV